METLPGWFWLIYYVFFFATLGTAIWSMKRKKLIRSSILAIILVLALPIVSFVNSIGRPRGSNELEVLAMQLQKGAWWAMFVVAGYLFLFVWWLFFLRKMKKAPME